MNTHSMHIIQASLADIPRIQQVAAITWPATFGTILSPEQIAYMMHWMYDTASLQHQMEHDGHIFLLALDGDDTMGFASYQTDYPASRTTKIHKLYVLPNQHGRGIGRQLIDVIGARARAHGQQALTLNVNRDNPAVRFYTRYGFTIARTEDIDIGNGYYMNDAVMELRLEETPAAKERE